MEGYGPRWYKLQVYGPRNGLSKFGELSDKLQVYEPKNAILKLIDLSDTLLQVNGALVHFTLYVCSHVNVTINDFVAYASF